MKVGIVTITELENFGNRLQNYALQKSLQELGIQVETIPNYIVYKHRKCKFYKEKEVIKGLITLRKKRIVKVYKQWRFEKFDQKYIIFSQYYSTKENISSKLSSSYDYFIAGSDQIWNPHFIFNFKFNFLTFAPQKKRIAYAASFGVNNIPDERKKQFRDYLNGIDFMSVREYEGQKIIKELTGKDVPVLIDPTLLLTKSDWKIIEKKPKWIYESEKYILTYCLGNAEKKNQIFKIIFNNYPKYKDYRIVDIYNIRNIKQYGITPDEFIWLIHHSELNITDSFHGIVFSILMETPFIHINREDNLVSMNSRIESLSRLLQLKISDSAIIRPDKEKINLLLREYRKAAIIFLKKSLNL